MENPQISSTVRDTENKIAFLWKINVCDSRADLDDIAQCISSATHWKCRVSHRYIW